MKPSPSYDFPVGVTAECDERPVALADVFAGLHSVRLNHTISIELVPAVDRRSPWPPELPEDVDSPQSSDEARRTAIRLARYAITPDAQRAGGVEMLAADPDGGVLFFVEPAEFDALLAECESLEKNFSGIHDAVPVSQLANSRLAKFLLERFVTSAYLSEYQLSLLGRTTPTS